MKGGPPLLPKSPRLFRAIGFSRLNFDRMWYWWEHTGRERQFTLSVGDSAMESFRIALRTIFPDA
ncbi:unnamed protein product [Prunus armeniaca]